MQSAPLIIEDQNNTDSSSTVSITPTHGVIWWLRRLGPLAFLGFFIKGMLWLIIPFMLAKGMIASKPQVSETLSQENIVKVDQ